MANSSVDNFFGAGAARDPGNDDQRTQAEFLVEVVSALQRAGHLATFASAAGGDGAISERRIATMHFYAYCNGIFGARQLAGLSETDSVVRELGGTHRSAFRDLLDYRDGANERLALFFTEVIVALADCGLETFLHTPLHAVQASTTRMERARTAAELAVTLLNAAKRRDDIETARYGLGRRGDELPPELLSAAEQAHRIDGMLRLRTADAEGGDWDEPTKLIDLTTLETPGFELALPQSYGNQLATAAKEAAESGLLPRLKTNQWEAVFADAEGVSQDWNPDASAGHITSAEQARLRAVDRVAGFDPGVTGPMRAVPSAGENPKFSAERVPKPELGPKVGHASPSRRAAVMRGQTAAGGPMAALLDNEPDALALARNSPGPAPQDTLSRGGASASGTISRTHSHSEGRPLIFPGDEPPSSQSAKAFSEPVRPAAAAPAAPATTGPQPGSSEAPAGDIAAEGSGDESTPVAHAKGSATALAGKWLMTRWRPVVWALLVLVIGAVVLTFVRVAGG